MTRKQVTEMKKLIDAVSRAGVELQRVASLAVNHPIDAEKAHAVEMLLLPGPGGRIREMLRAASELAGYSMAVLR